MYRKIVVPLDGSKLAECALGHVEEIAKGCSVPEVDLVRVLRSFPYWMDGDDMSYIDPRVLEKVMAEEKSSAKDYLDKMVKDLKKKGITARSIVLNGEPAQNILEFAEKNGADLIVMSSHGRSGPARWALGSVAERVTQHSSIPVMVVAAPGCRISA
jgi:nucleotide-binding universal stress UspA family protein